MPDNAEIARVEYGSVLPGATEPDMFYETLDEAVVDCSFGPCRIVQRTVMVTPWIEVPRRTSSAGGGS